MNLKKLKDAYFGKDVYARKAEYAYRKSSDGVESIARYYAEKDGLTEDDKEYEDVFDDYVRIFEPVSELSHLRHNIHSSGVHYNLNFWESSYEKLIDDINELNGKYDLSPVYIEYLNWESLPDTDVMSYAEVCDELGWNQSDWLDENGDLIWEKKDMFYDDIANLISDEIDKWSDSVREWFWYVNQKFGTDFPDKKP